MSIRLDADLHRRVVRMARHRGQSKSELVRDVLETATASGGTDEKGSPLFDRIAHLAGCVRSDRGDLSRRTGEKFKDLLRERRARG